VISLAFGHADRNREADRYEPINFIENGPMNIHKNARISPQSRPVLIQRVVEECGSAPFCVAF
jgi:hypothetical protein